jgi:molybdate transport system permease protein
MDLDWNPLWLSVKIASLSTLVTLVFGLGFALLLSWRKLPFRHFIDALVSAPLVLPPTVLGYYLLVVLGRDTPIGHAWRWLFGSDIAFTFTGAVIAAAAGSLPLVVRSMRLGIDAVEPNLIAAARTLGARPARVLATVVVPLALPGIVAGAMLGFARALGDYGATQMLTTGRIDGTWTASNYVMNEMTRPGHHDSQVFAMSLATTIVGVTLLYFANRMTHRLDHRV